VQNLLRADINHTELGCTCCKGAVKKEGAEEKEGEEEEKVEDDACRILWKARNRPLRRLRCLLKDNNNNNNNNNKVVLEKRENRELCTAYILMFN
jgi:hypothetical protein